MAAAQPGSANMSPDAQAMYQGALGNLGNALNLSNQTTSGLMTGAQNQLAQNQGKVQQGLVNSGLGNTTVAQTMQQAPLNTYNQAVQNIQNQGAERGMGAYGNIAGLQGQIAGGLQSAGLQNYMQNLQGLQSEQKTGPRMGQFGLGAMGPMGV